MLPVIGIHVKSAVPGQGWGWRWTNQPQDGSNVRADNHGANQGEDRARKQNQLAYFNSTTFKLIKVLKSSTVIVTNDYITVLISVTWEANVNPSRILPEYTTSLFGSGTKTNTFVKEKPFFLLKHSNSIPFWHPDATKVIGSIMKLEEDRKVLPVTNHSSSWCTAGERSIRRVHPLVLLPEQYHSWTWCLYDKYRHLRSPLHRHQKPTHMYTLMSACIF